MSLPRYCQERQSFDYIFHQINVFENDFLRKYCFKAISKGFDFSPKPLDLISIFSLDRIEIGEYTYQRLIWLSKFRKRGPFP